MREASTAVFVAGRTLLALLRLDNCRTFDPVTQALLLLEKPIRARFHSAHYHKLKWRRVARLDLFATSKGKILFEFK